MSRTVKRICHGDTLTFARQQRREGTSGEDLLWQHLRNRRLGVKFRRQHPVDGYVLDFYCPELRLAIEVDGPHHAEQKRYDRQRQQIVAGHGIRFLRLTSRQMAGDIELVLGVIREELMALKEGE